MKKVIVGLFIISLLTRGLFLFKGMPSLTHDEADFYYSGYTLAKKGADQHNNKVFLTSGYISAIPAVPVYTSALFWKLAPEKNIFYARLPFAFLNSFTPVLLFAITLALSSSFPLALLSFFIINFSPWFLHLSATAAFDSPLALMFSLFGTLLLIKAKKNKVFILPYLLTTFLAFNSYMGFKTLFPFLVIWQLILWCYVNKIKVSKEFALKILFVTFILFAIFTGLVYIAPQSSLFKERASETIVFLNKGIVENDIWYARLTTTGSAIIKQLFANKIFTPAYLFFSKYIRSFDLNLFFVGESHVIYGLRILGLFFMTDVLFLVIGLITFQKQLNTRVKFLLLLFFIGGIPFATSIEGITAAIRGYFLIVPYTILIASGYLYLINKNRRLVVPLIIFFIVNVVGFFVIYQARISVLSSEAWHLTDKIVIEETLKETKPVDIYTEEPRNFFLLYSFYSKIDPKKANTQLLNPNLTEYKDTNKIFHLNCDSLKEKLDPNRLILINPGRCSTEFQKIKYTILKSYLQKDMTDTVMYILVQPSTI